MGLLTTDPVLLQAAKLLRTSHGLACPTASTEAALPRACHLLLIDAATVDVGSWESEHCIVLRGGHLQGALANVPQIDDIQGELTLLATAAIALMEVDRPAIQRVAASFPGGEVGARQYLRSVVARAASSMDQMLHAAARQEYETVRRLSWELSPHLGILGMSSLRNTLRQVETGAFERRASLTALIAVARHRWRVVSTQLMAELQPAPLDASPWPLSAHAL